MNRWRYEFREDGGYDSMSAAFHVFWDKGRVFVIDVADFVRGTVLYNHGDDTTKYDLMHERNKTAEELTQFLVNALNTFGK